jgi:hypothetical protein
MIRVDSFLTAANPATYLETESRSAFRLVVVALDTSTLPRHIAIGVRQ